MCCVSYWLMQMLKLIDKLRKANSSVWTRKHKTRWMTTPTLDPRRLLASGNSQLFCGRRCSDVLFQPHNTMPPRRSPPSLTWTANQVESRRVPKHFSHMSSERTCLTLIMKHLLVEERGSPLADVKCHVFRLDVSSPDVCSCSRDFHCVKIDNCVQVKIHKWMIRAANVDLRNV